MTEREPLRRRAGVARRLVLLLACLVGCAGAPLASDTELPYSSAVAARFPAPTVHHETPGLAEWRRHYTADDEMQAWLDELVRAGANSAARVTRIDAGRSQQGVPLQALRFSRGAGHPAVLLIGQQHGDEPAGAEALMVLARELAQGPGAAVLDRIDVAMLVRANPDGAARATRVAADGTDINRDHLLLRTPEARAIALLAREFEPIVVVDLHEYTVAGRYLEKFDAVQRYDVLLQYATTANYAAALSEASERWFIEPLRGALEREGLSHEWYYTNPITPDDLRISMGGLQPDTGRNVHGLKQTVSILLESRGVGIGRLHLQRRVHSQLVALRSLLDSAAAHAPELLALRHHAGAALAATACRGDMVVLATSTTQQRDLVMLDPVSGADKTLSVQWESALQPRALRTRERPCGYWLAADAGLAVQRLRELGVQVRRFAGDAPLQAEAWRELSRRIGARPDVRGVVADAQGSVIDVRVALQPLAASAPAGSWYVPLDQPLAQLAVAALEPDTPSSYYANRVLPSLDAALRVRTPPDAAWAP